LWDGQDGDIDPAQLCQALAFHARRAGAEVYRSTPVIGLSQHKDDTWTVHTAKGDIDADIVVNACGYRVNEVGAMMGVHHPVASMEHQYFVTEDIPEIAEAGHRMPLLRCPISDFYSRQEKNGLLVGFYEQDCKPWGMDGISSDFSNDLCPDDLDRVIREAQSRRGSGVPTVVLMKTEMGKGVDFMEGTHKWHGIAPNDDQLADALNQLESTLEDY
jgi:dimethylglycine dehydrogenase